jgi:hypothetical protein
MDSVSTPTPSSNPDSEVNLIVSHSDEFVLFWLLMYSFVVANGGYFHCCDQS